jgi:transposase
MPAQYVKPYVKTNKNDYIDAEAIAEAVDRPRMRYVPIKSEDQLDMQSVHRARERWVKSRTSLVNQMRGLLLERGITIRKGRRHAEAMIPTLLEDAESNLSGPLRLLLSQLMSELRQVTSQIADIDATIMREADKHDACRRLMGIPGIGPTTATAIVCAIGNGAEFRKARSFSAWLGLVPGEYSTGGKQKLLGISKRGNGYLRKLLAHGARAILQCREKQSPGLSAWLGKLIARAHPNIVTIALANKMARMAWVLLTRGETYRPPLLTPPAAAA